MSTRCVQGLNVIVGHGGHHHHGGGWGGHVPTEQIRGGVEIPYWDNKTSFLFGDVVRYNEKYWKATREVNPPTFPFFQSGDVPGDSDAWKPVGNSAVREMLKGIVGELVGDDEWAHRQGTARDFGLLDMAFACVVGGHLAASEALENYARQISGQILNQTSPPMTAETFRKQLEMLALEIKKITNRNPLDEIYSGPKFKQSQNDYFSGKVLDTAQHFSEESSAEIKKKFDDATKGLSNLMTTVKWIGIGGAIVLVLALATGVGFGVHSRLKK